MDYYDSASGTSEFLGVNLKSKRLRLPCRIKQVAAGLNSPNTGKVSLVDFYGMMLNHHAVTL
jgi:hypothetical protein